MTEDVASTRAVKQLAAGARTAFIPQCGLAPGFITIVASDLASRFDELQDVRMRVGALPKFPSNALNYNLTWSTDGVINEYCEPCEAIVNGQLRETQPLEELEEFSLDGVLYEAFNTSGGLGTLCETLAGKVRNLNYRTIRYPGHAAIMKALLNDLRLRDRRDLLKDILENSVPVTLQDVVIVFVTVSGLRARPAHPGNLRQQDLCRTGRRAGAQRHPDHDRGRHLRRARHAERGALAAVGAHQAGRHQVAGLPRQPLRALLRDGRRPRPTPPDRQSPARRRPSRGRSRLGRAAAVGDLVLVVDESPRQQPLVGILGVLGKPGRGAAQAKGVSPLVHVAAHALAADVRQRVRQQDLQVAHRILLGMVAAGVRVQPARRSGVMQTKCAPSCSTECTGVSSRT